MLLGLNGLALRVGRRSSASVARVLMAVFGAGPFVEMTEPAKEGEAPSFEEPLSLPNTDDYD